MTIQYPIVAPLFVTHEGDIRRRRVKLAVRVRDEFTGVEPVPAVRMRLKQRTQQARRGQEPLLSRDGYACFVARMDSSGGPWTDLPDDADPTQVGNQPYTLVLEFAPAAQQRYFMRSGPGAPWGSVFERDIDLPRPDPKNPVVEVVLKPTPAYPFPGGATLLRGRVTRAAVPQPTPVDGAIVTTQYQRVDPADFQQEVQAAVETRTDRNGEYVLVFPEVSRVNPRQNINVTARLPQPPPPGPRQQAAQIQDGTTTVSVDFAFP